MKRSDPAAFATYFHSLGIDVDTVGLTVVDPGTGTIKRGGAAVKAVMDDKRLTAVFQNAGANSLAFQAAQVKRAQAEYYLAPRSFTVTQGGATITGNYEDVLTSEAGKVALMDRAVQRGVGSATSTFATASKGVMTRHGVTTLADLARYEIEIIPALSTGSPSSARATWPSRPLRRRRRPPRPPQRPLRRSTRLTGFARPGSMRLGKYDFIRLMVSITMFAIIGVAGARGEPSAAGRASSALAASHAGNRASPTRPVRFGSASRLADPSGRQ